MAGYYVGIDISKKTLDVAITKDGKKVLGHKQFSNSLKGYRDIKRWINEHAEFEGGVLVCTESTGAYGKKLERFVQEQTGYELSVCNPFAINSFGKSRLSRTKTDKADAMLIAQFAERMNPKITKPENRTIGAIKEKLRYIHSIKASVIAEKNKLDHYDDPRIIRMIKLNIVRLEKQIVALNAEVMVLKESDLGVKTNHDLLVSIPSISTQTALTVLSEMIPQEIGAICRKVQTAHAGLAPAIRQSGTSVFSCKLTRYSSLRLKNALYFPTLNAIRNNPIITQFYRHLLNNGKPKMVAIIACMRKLLHICIGVLNNQTLFNPTFTPVFRPCVSS
jgi:transposase